jgi:hypothetical protein
VPKAFLRPGLFFLPRPSQHMGTRNSACNTLA